MGEELCTFKGTDQTTFIIQIHVKSIGVKSIGAQFWWVYLRLLEKKTEIGCIHATVAETLFFTIVLTRRTYAKNVTDVKVR